MASFYAVQIDNLKTQVESALNSGNYQSVLQYAQQAENFVAGLPGSLTDSERYHINSQIGIIRNHKATATQALQTQQATTTPPVAATPPPFTPTYSLPPQEAALQEEIRALLQGQRRDIENLQPLLLYSLRLKQEGNTVRKMTEPEYLATLTPTEQTEYQNYQLALERNQRALKGELPVSVASTLRKQEEFKQFKEVMARAGNKIEGDTPDTATSDTTPGIQSLSEFNKRWGVVEEAERRGELDTGTTQLLQRMGIASNIGSQERASLLNMPGAYNKVISGYQGAMQPYQYYANLGNQQYLGNLEADTRRYTAGLETSGALARQQLARDYSSYGKYGQRASLLSGLGQLGGQLAGYIASSFIPSARKYKKDIKQQSGGAEEEMLDMVKDTDTYTYRYKGEGRNVPERMGLMADNAPTAITMPDRNGLDVGRTLGLLFVTTKALAKKVNKLEGRRGGYRG